MARADASGKSIAGENNLGFSTKIPALLQSNTYRDLSTVWVTPTPKGQLDAQVVFQSWLSMALPMNQKFQRLAIANGEVGKAYDLAVETILADTVKWKYLLTVEHDNLPPRDGLLKLYESIEKFDAVGGLYWMKGEGGTPMIYGDPVLPGNFAPQAVVEGTIQPCNGLGMGFTLFNLDMFRALPKPWFVTDDLETVTQDLAFFSRAGKAGYKFACDNRVKVGHLDFTTRKIW